MGDVGSNNGIVGATVVAMGLISLPAMLRNNYSKPLATGTICASGTLGKLFRLHCTNHTGRPTSKCGGSSSYCQKRAGKQATGQFSTPSEFSIISTSAGDMFLGVFLPGLVLVGLYMAYILIAHS